MAIDTSVILKRDFGLQKKGAWPSRPCGDCPTFSRATSPNHGILLFIPIAESIWSFGKVNACALRGGLCLSEPHRCVCAGHTGPDKTRATAQLFKGKDECLAREGNRSEAEKQVPPARFAGIEVLDKTPIPLKSPKANGRWYHRGGTPVPLSAPFIKTRDVVETTSTIRRR